MLSVFNPLSLISWGEKANSDFGEAVPFWSVELCWKCFHCIFLQHFYFPLVFSFKVCLAQRPLTWRYSPHAVPGQVWVSAGCEHLQGGQSHHRSCPCLPHWLIHWAAFESWFVCDQWKLGCWSQQREVRCQDWVVLPWNFFSVFSILNTPNV